jgi:hypothetical protein
MMLLSVSLTDSSFAFHLDISSFFFLILFVQDIILGKFSFFFSFLCIRKGERQKSSTIIRVYVQPSTVLV